MRLIAFISIFISLLSCAMDNDSFVITIAGAREQILQEHAKTLRFVQQKDQLLKQAESNIENSLWAFLPSYMWLYKMLCMNGPSLLPTMTDVHILGCSCGIGCALCIAACSDCHKVMTLKKE